MPRAEHTTEQHPNWVTFETVNALRFPYNPVPDSQWRRWCREHKVPCCKFPDGWRIDLTRFDTQFSVSDDAADIDEDFVSGLARNLGVPS